MDKVKDIDIDLYSCLQCGYCKDTCPAYEQFGWESDCPRGKVFYLKRMGERSIFGKKKRLEADQSFYESLFHCTSCGMCDEVCHVEISLSDVWEEVKEWLAEQGMESLPGHKELSKRIYDPNKRNPFFDPNDPEKDFLENRGKWIPDDVELSENPEVVYFVGCTAAYRMQFLAQATVNLLKAADVKFSIIGPDEWCCGSPLLRTGLGDKIKEEYVPHNINALQGQGVKDVVTACAGCYKTIKENYLEIAGFRPFDVYHISEYLYRLIKEKKLEFTKEFDKKVVYHDPCHLGRHAGVFDEPREVIKAVPGVELLEMPRNRERARCCGAGGGFKIAFNDQAEEIAADRVREAVETGGDVIVTPCPFCVVNLNAGARRAGLDIKTIDLVELCEQCI